jgi:hypothetical protein
MSSKRKLTGDEKSKIIDDSRTLARTFNPRAEVMVVVEDETDEAGQPIVRIQRQ